MGTDLDEFSFSKSKMLLQKSLILVVGAGSAGFLYLREILIPSGIPVHNSRSFLSEGVFGKTPFGFITCIGERHDSDATNGFSLTTDAVCEYVAFYPGFRDSYAEAWNAVVAVNLRASYWGLE